MAILPSFLSRRPLVSVIRLNGVIASGQRGLSDAGTADMIERAFVRGKPKAVALAINSPGGSPAQSSLIAARIRRLAEEKKLPVTAFVEDAAASGGYWLACAADDILVDANSIVGSIGVISAGFGLQEAIGRIGIERRVHTAGRSKSFLDPFRPEKEEDVIRLRALQDQIHENFIAHVKARRGDRLDTKADLFTGDVWIGQQAVARGLADGVGHLVATMKDRHGDKVRFAVHGPRRGLLRRFGLSIAADAAAELEERALWARYGL
ncbi:S49 family peptidase [Tropicimonas sp. IMCC6043]|uniref:S49 family peptidase n=1 Tax=Tropicimonas sp. IMCC6043 TaxID=2510645 RepID=UPI00101BC9EB|nr:S49 family peptidase [Tropicimonas sp. IMCC6043]RYH07317.1 S49 family peptidase [Tropicimonas sp. IMCC6043]